MLTEAELLAMSDNDYMNDAQKTFFKALLIEQKNELIEAIESAKKELSTYEHNIDEGDIASSQEMQQFHLRTVDRQSKLLRKINESIKSIDTGEYGYCEETGEPIGIQRLLARPTATLSVQAKEIQEHQEKTLGSIRETE